MHNFPEMERSRKLLMDELGRKSVDEFKASEKLPVVLVLDHVRSMNNIGSIFRTSDAFLVEAIYLCGITATPPHREIHKTALGAEKAVTWTYFQDTMAAIGYLQQHNYTIVSLEQTSGSIMLQDFKPETSSKYAFVLGNEIRGVQQGVVDISDLCIEIPQFGTKHSFNITVSAGILLWEFSRKWEQQKKAVR